MNILALLLGRLYLTVYEWEYGTNVGIPKKIGGTYPTFRGFVSLGPILETFLTVAAFDFGHCSQ